MLVNFRIGGAVWGERVQYEPLTDVVNLLPLWQQEPVSLRLARQMQALCICAKELLAEYSIHTLGISTQRSLLYANGIPPVLHDSTRCVCLASWSGLAFNMRCPQAFVCAYSHMSTGSYLSVSLMLSVVLDPLCVASHSN